MKVGNIEHMTEQEFAVEFSRLEVGQSVIYATGHLWHERHKAEYFNGEPYIPLRRVAACAYLKYETGVAALTQKKLDIDLYEYRAMRIADDSKAHDVRR